MATTAGHSTEGKLNDSAQLISLICLLLLATAEKEKKANNKAAVSDRNKMAAATGHSGKE
jgi:hypothetical protein